MKKPTLTLDTSCVMSLLHLPEDSTPPDERLALEKIQQWGIESRIDIYISEKSRTEALLNQERAQKHDPDNRIRFEKWSKTLNILKNYSTVSGRWIMGISRLGIDTVLGSENESDNYQKMAQLLFGTSPNNLKEGDLFDLAILFKHFIQGNDLFVTRDMENNIIKKKSEIKQEWKIVVCTPIEAVKILPPASKKLVQATDE